jgi:hypothetical protein
LLISSTLHTGIIFLATNVGRTIDPAILSRTQVHLEFPALTKSLRVRVWENFTERLPGDVGTLAPAEIDALADWKFNGREIKNILNMSVSWCRKKKQRLSRGVVEYLVPVICPSASKEEVVDSERKTNGCLMSDSAGELALLDL